MGLLVSGTPVMGAGVTPEPPEYLQPRREMKSMASVPVALEGATITADQAYVDISSRLDYQASTGSAGRRITYTVQPGDSLWQISHAYDTDPPTLFSLNPDLESALIQPGEKLQVIPGFRGVSHTVRWGETLSEIASMYAIPMGDIINTNRLESGDELQIGQELLLPGAEVLPETERVMVATSRGGSSRRDGKALGWIWPITSGLHSSEFGEPRWGSVHTGIDIAAPTGTPATAVADGTVIFAGWDNGYGYSVLIDHDGGLQTRYAHASQLLVSAGQWVNQGEEVIRVGATGNSTGPHLHFEVLLEGVALNPRLYLP